MGGTRSEPVFRGVYVKSYVQFAWNLLNEPTVQLLMRIKHQTIPLRALFTSCHKSGILVSFKQSGYLSIGKKSIHAFQEAGVKNVRLVHNETDLLALAASSAENYTEILIEIVPRVFI